LDNIYQTTTNRDPVIIIKNLFITSPYDPDISDLESLNWNNIYKIFVDLNNSDISEIELYYRYSNDNQNWSNWIQYGDTLNSSPYEWDFSIDNGTGFYEFKINAWNSFGQFFESEIQSIEILYFPVYTIILMILSLIILLIVTIIILKKMNK
jgi:hypothetical protein